jgi:hypothetical protein
MIWMAATPQMAVPSPAVAGVNALGGAYFGVAALAWPAVAIRHERLSLEWMGNALMSVGMTAVLLFRI